MEDFSLDINAILSPEEAEAFLNDLFGVARIPMRDDGAELALLGLRLARHLDLAKPERWTRIDFLYGHNRFSPIWEPPLKRMGRLDAREYNTTTHGV